MRTLELCTYAGRAPGLSTGICRPSRTPAGVLRTPCQNCPLRPPARLCEDFPVFALAQVLLQALVPLLERRVLASERQAVAAEALEQTVRTYLAYSDPGFRDLLLGVAPSDSDPVDVQADSGSARDLKYSRMEELRQLWFAQHGELLDDERLVQEYERLYTEAEQRLSADTDAVGVTH